MDYLREVESKIAHDPFTQKMSSSSLKSVWVPGPVVVGGGPSGLAVAACLKERGVPSLILERSNCIASMWQHKTYNRLRLHLPKSFCELPLMPFPSHFPTYPNRQQFLAYLDDYARHFKLEPLFNRTVVSAELDHGYGSWKVKAVGPENIGETEYICQWLVVATGENADDFIPQIEGINEFSGPVFHTSAYKCGDPFRGKNVLVVGCGNSGMEVALDLCNFHSRPTLVVRNSVHILPREMFGLSTFWISMWLLKWLPISLVDRFLLLMARLIIGDTACYGIPRPKLGPLELKRKTGKTPVLDVGTLAKIKSGDIKVRQGIKRVTRQAVEFLDGKVENFDAILLATGYKSNVPTWLKENNLFTENGLPSQPFPNGWKGEDGLYAVGFSQRGLLGSSMVATRIAEDIENQWRADAKQFKAFTHAVPQPQPQP